MRVLNAAHGSCVPLFPKSGLAISPRLDVERTRSIRRESVIAGILFAKSLIALLSTNEEEHEEYSSLRSERVPRTPSSPMAVRSSARGILQ